MDGTGGALAGGKSERVDGTGGALAGGKASVEGGWVWEFRDLEREWEEKRAHELPDGWLACPEDRGLGSRLEFRGFDGTGCSLDDEGGWLFREKVVDVRVVVED